MSSGYMARPNMSMVLITTSKVFSDIIKHMEYGLRIVDACYYEWCYKQKFRDLAVMWEN